MNKMKIFNFVYKIKIAKTEKSSVVDRLKMAYRRVSVESHITDIFRIFQEKQKTVFLSFIWIKEDFVVNSK